VLPLVGDAIRTPNGSEGPIRSWTGSNAIALLKSSGTRLFLFADAEVGEDAAEEIVGRHFAGNGAEGVQRLT